MCLLDATYRTKKYDLPLYFLCVRTNVCFQMVGSFVIQYENTQCITEALMVFKEWNKETLSLSCFMVDFAEEEILALEIVFQGTYTYRKKNTGLYTYIQVCILYTYSILYNILCVHRQVYCKGNAHIIYISDAPRCTCGDFNFAMLFTIIRCRSTSL